MHSSDYWREQAAKAEAQASYQPCAQARQRCLDAAREWHDDANFAEMIEIGPRHSRQVQPARTAMDD